MAKFCLMFGVLCAGIAACTASAGSDSFKVAEVKPHYGCTSADGQERVRKYVADLVASGTGLISLIQVEFTLPQPPGYTAFGAACGRHYDPAAVLVSEAQFEVVSTLGATVAGNYSAVPYIGGGGGPAPRNATNWMCTSDPEASYGPGGNWTAGSRPYAGAVLLHKDSGKEICMVTGTMAHCLYKWTDQFVADVEQGCGDRQLLIVADTNAGCEVPTIKSDSHWSLDQILANHSKADWGPCHDPGLYKEPTCCNDFPEFPFPRYWYDRIAVCRGGGVEDFKVESAFVCGESPAEHLPIMATVHLARSNGTESQYCLDHRACANRTPITNQDTQILPVDGLCCPTSTSNNNLPCCNSVSPE